MTTQEVEGFEIVLERLKSSLLKYSAAARKLATAITEQIKTNEKSRTGDPGLIDVPVGLVLAVMH